MISTEWVNSPIHPSLGIRLGLGLGLQLQLEIGLGLGMGTENGVMVK